MENPFAAYPLYLRATDIMEATQLSKTKVHSMMNEPDFPLIRQGKSKLVNRDKFFKWFTSKENISIPS